MTICPSFLGQHVLLYLPGDLFLAVFTILFYYPYDVLIAFIALFINPVVN